jgi:hypothetical protein
MTFPLSGTLNSVQTALSANVSPGITAATITAWVGLEASSSPPAGPAYGSFPFALSHGAVESFWPDPGLINQMNVVLTQSNYQYRI